MVLKQQFKFFGPAFESYSELVGNCTEVRDAINLLYDMLPMGQRGLFRVISEKEICKEDKTFLWKIMKYDWRERPTAQQLLEDKWFEDGEVKV